VAGGSGADEDMMRGNTLAVVVANRHHEELSQLIDQQRIYFANHQSHLDWVLIWAALPHDLRAGTRPIAARAMAQRVGRTDKATLLL